MTKAELAKKLSSMKTQDICLLAGEMTAQEMRTVKAILKWVAREIEKTKELG